MEILFKITLHNYPSRGVGSELQVNAMVYFPDIFHNEAESIVHIEQIKTVPQGLNIDPNLLSSEQFVIIEHAALAYVEKING